SQRVAEPPVSRPTVEAVADPTSVVAPQTEMAKPMVVASSLYELFLAKFADEAAAGPVAADALQDTLELNKAQLADWLKRGIADGRIEKLNKPVRYQLAKAQQPTLL